MNIVLTGFMASGKTTIGKRLAELCGRRFADTDLMVEEKYGMPVSEMFSAFGEEYFRRAESEAAALASAEDGLVIATGGGLVLNTANVDKLRENGVIVNLSPEEAVIRARLSGDDPTRPLASGSSIEEILGRFRLREPYYNNCDVQIKITAEEGIEETAERILNILEEKYETTFRSSR